MYSYLRDPEIIAKQDFSKVPTYYVESLKRIQEMSFADFVCSDDPVHANNVSNLYGIYLAGDAWPAGMPADEMLSHCCDRLRDVFHYVGLTSSLAEDMDVIQSICFPEVSTRFGNLTTNASRKEGADIELGDKALGIVRERLGLDLEIYRRACQLRDERYRSFRLRTQQPGSAAGHAPPAGAATAPEQAPSSASLTEVPSGQASRGFSDPR